MLSAFHCRFALSVHCVLSNLSVSRWKPIDDFPGSRHPLHLGSTTPESFVENSLGLEIRVALVPVGFALKRVTGLDQTCFIEMTADKLECHRPAAFREAGGQRNCGTSCHVERSGEAEKAADQVGVLGQGRHLGERRRGKGLCGNRKKTAGPQQPPRLPPEVFTPQYNLLIVGSGLLQSQIQQSPKPRAIPRLARGIRSLMRDGRLYTAQSKPVCDQRCWIGERHFLDLRAECGGYAKGFGKRLSGRRIDPFAGPTAIDTNLEATEIAAQPGEVTWHVGWDRGRILWIGAGDRAKHRAAVGRVARHGPNVIQRCRQFECAIATDAPPCRLQPRDPVGSRWKADRSASIGAERAVTEAR